MEAIKTLFRKWNNITKCPNCKSKEQKEVNFDKLDGIITLEYDVVCGSCGNHLNHYAFGSLEYPETKTEYLGYIWKYMRPSNLIQVLHAIKDSIEILSC